MFVVMEEGASELQVQNVIDLLVNEGFTVHRSTGVVHTVLGCVGPKEEIDPVSIELMEGVKECHRVMAPYKLASHRFRPGGTRFTVRGVEIGGDRVIAIAGPCSVENEDQIEACASLVALYGGKGLRGGTFKPRASPY